MLNTPFRPSLLSESAKFVGLFRERGASLLNSECELDDGMVLAIADEALTHRLNLDVTVKPLALAIDFEATSDRFVPDVNMDVKLAQQSQPAHAQTASDVKCTTLNEDIGTFGKRGRDEYRDDGENPAKRQCTAALADASVKEKFRPWSLLSGDVCPERHCEMAALTVYALMELPGVDLVRYFIIIAELVRANFMDSWRLC
jgi:hypothetical protein